MVLNTPAVASAAHPNGKGCKIVNGTRLFYEVKGEGQPLIFIHGFTLDHRMWDDQFYYFSRHYQCIRFDMRGFGQSALPGMQPYSYAEDLEALLNALHITQPVILVGHSIGGVAASSFALQFRHRTRALVLTSAEIEGYIFREFKKDSIFNHAKNRSIEYARLKWIEHDLFMPARKNKTTAECLEQMIHFYSGWHFVSDNPIHSYTPSLWDDLHKINVPTLVIYGELDLPDFKEIGENAVAKIPGSRKVILPDTGHISNMENPALFNKELQQFLVTV